MKFYRYEAVQYANIDHDGEYCRPSFPCPRIELREFNVHKETPKGYWIGYGTPDGFMGKSRWISKISGRKRYAYPTKEEAMVNYVKRTEKHIYLLRSQLETAEIALERALAIQNNVSASKIKEEIEKEFI